MTRSGIGHSTARYLRSGGISEGSRLAVYRTLSSTISLVHTNNSLANSVVYAPCTRFYFMDSLRVSTSYTIYTIYSILSGIFAYFMFVLFSLFLSVLPSFCCYALAGAFCVCSSDLFLSSRPLAVPDWQPRILLGMFEVLSASVLDHVQ